MKLIITVGYYQTLLALRMKQTLFRNEEVALVVTDASKGGRELAENIENMGVFSNVFFFEDYTHFRPEVKKPFFWKVQGIKESITGKGKRLGKLFGTLVIEELIFSDVSMASLAMFAFFYKRNRCLKVSMMEEGLISYSALEDAVSGKKGKNRARLYLFRRTLGKRNLTDVIERIYVQIPELISEEHRIMATKIPAIWDSDEAFRELITKAWKLDKVEITYRERYIYFSTTDEDFDLKAVESIASIVGKDNLLIKLHPRNFSGEFAHRGYKIAEKSTYPWEVVGLNCDFSGKVFITALSSAALLQLLLGQHTQNIYLASVPEYRSEKNNAQLISNTKRVMEWFNIDSKRWRFLESMDELPHILRKLGKEE